MTEILSLYDLHEGDYVVVFKRGTQGNKMFHIGMIMEQKFPTPKTMVRISLIQQFTSYEVVYNNVPYKVYSRIDPSECQLSYALWCYLKLTDDEKFAVLADLV
jgi:hypothetical protein